MGASYPDATKWASPGARKASRKQGWDFDVDLTGDGTYDWSDEIKHILVKGSRFLEEYVFFHASSRTLIFADLIENFECHKIESPFLRWVMKLTGIIHPDGKLPADLRLSYWGHHKQLRQALETMLVWQPEKIIVAHGHWYDHDGVAELKRAFRWVKGFGDK